MCSHVNGKRFSRVQESAMSFRFPKERRLRTREVMGVLRTKDTQAFDRRKSFSR